jgi:hypothetical protein
MSGLLACAGSSCLLHANGVVANEAVRAQEGALVQRGVAVLQRVAVLRGRVEEEDRPVLSCTVHVVSLDTHSRKTGAR